MEKYSFLADANIIINSIDYYHHFYNYLNSQALKSDNSEFKVLALYYRKKINTAKNNIIEMIKNDIQINEIPQNFISLKNGN